MKSKRSRIMLMGVLALVMSVTVGLVSGSVADAKKKKKKGAKSFLVAKTTPTAVPLAVAGIGPGVAKVPIGTVGGKKLKGKAIAFNSVQVTTSWSGGAGFGTSAFAAVIAGNGRTVGLTAPAFDTTSAAQGPVTETPNSPNSYCTPDAAPPPPPCTDPDANVFPPAYAGTIGNVGLTAFGGQSPNGTWFVKVFNGSTTVPLTLNSITVTGNLINALR